MFHRPPHASGCGGLRLASTIAVLCLTGCVQDKLTAAEGATGDHFGRSVALDGDTAVVGAVSGTDPGAAYVLVRDGVEWSQAAKLTAEDGVPGDHFGASVAVSGDTIVVGMRGDPDLAPSPGAAYVFIRDGDDWVEQARLTAADGAVGDFFGHSVALAGDTALVGASQADVDGNSDEGAAYVFVRSEETWEERAKLTAPDGDLDTDAQFGRSVALRDDTALVGAPGADGPIGRAYVFVRGHGGWEPQAELHPFDVEQRQPPNQSVVGNPDLFGDAVALAGETALVGASGDVVDGNVTQGAAYVFVRSGGAWTPQAKLTVSDGMAFDGFGSSVALVGTRRGLFPASTAIALVGAHGVDGEDGSNQGAAYLFVREEGVWSSEEFRIDAFDGAKGDEFGRAVALSGDTALVGTPSADVDANADQGAAYVFVPPLTPVGLAADFASLDSDGNGVFEPGEEVELAPAWRLNLDPTTAHGGEGVIGVMTDFTGPDGADYDLGVDQVAYPFSEPGQAVDCRDTEICYSVGVDDPGVRPAMHWDAGVTEVLGLESDPEPLPIVGIDWPLHIGDSFTDVPRSSLFYHSVETVLHVGVVEALQQVGLTGGCPSGGAFCPTSATTRAEMPMFLLKAVKGPDFVPQPCVEGEERFADVPADTSICPWIEDLARRQITAGCGDGAYCPDAPVTRSQTAIFLLKTLEGAGYAPPACQGDFADVPCSSVFADWIEELFSRQITAGCATDPVAYCPANPVTRQQMATFVSKSFDLTLYGP